MAKEASKDLVFKIGSPLVTIGIYDPTLDELADEIDVTDSESGGSREYLAGYANRTITFSRWLDSSTEPDDIGDEVDFSWTIGSTEITGTVVILGRNLAATREDAHKFAFTARVDGDLTYTVT